MRDNINNCTASSRGTVFLEQQTLNKKSLLHTEQELGDHQFPKEKERSQVKLE
jgi:hypothetical protein